MLLRNSAQETLFKSLNVTPIILKNADSPDELRAIAANFDIIINPAYATFPAHSKALVLGLGDRLKANPKGPVPHIIHTSGTSNVADRPYTLPSRKLQHEYSDINSAAIYAVEKDLEASEPYAQRTTELTVTDTGLDVGVQTHIITSPTIYGPGTGPGNKLSIQIPLLIRSIVKHGYAFVVGDGSQEWDHISITALTSLYSTFMSRIISGAPVPSGKEGIFFSEAGPRHSWKHLVQVVVDAGIRVGKLKKGIEVKSLSLQEAADNLGLGAMPGFVELGFASNSRTKAERAKEWGWSANEGEEEFRKGVEGDWRAVIEKDGL